MNDEEGMWVVLIFGGMFLGAIAASTFVLAIVCTVAAIKGSYSVRPIAVYWCACGWIAVSATLVDLWFAASIFGFISPVFLGLFWYYDRRAAKQITTALETKQHDINR